MGYQQNVYKGRVQEFNGAVAGNEYEDAVSALVGLKICLNEKWSLRGDVPIDYNPSPNFNGSTVTLDGKSNMGCHVRIRGMLRGANGATTAAATATSTRPPPPPATTVPTLTPTPPAFQTPPVATSVAGDGRVDRRTDEFRRHSPDPEQGNDGIGAVALQPDGDIGTGPFTRTFMARTPSP
jgi:hypothetical protein